MHHSQPFKSSPHCKASPDGNFVAALHSSSVLIRSIKTLQIVHAVKLSAELTGPVTALLWSPSSLNILVCAGDRILVASACDASFRAVICDASLGPGGKLPLISFGATDAEVLVCALSGLKLSVFDLSTSKSLEIGNPKFFHPTSASRGFSFRPSTGHLVVLTRTAGKDVLSIHHPSTRQITTSWSPDCLDAQGVEWTPDGRWILLWETPSQGRRLLIHGADGQLYRVLGASMLAMEPKVDVDANLELGFKACQLSRNGEFCALGDHSRGVTILQTGIWRSTMRLWHPHVITPLDTLRVWQEHSSGNGGHGTFTRATQPLSPAAVSDGTMQAANIRSGCSSMSFDASSTLLATRLDECPSTIWIWDLAVEELRATLIFHSPVGFAWHPSLGENLLINGSQDEGPNKFLIWDPLSEGPVYLDVERFLPPSKVAHGIQVNWLNSETQWPELLVTDLQHCALLSLADAASGINPWEAAEGGPAWEATPSEQGISERVGLTEPVDITEDIAKLDDTFAFRRT